MAARRTWWLGPVVAAVLAVGMVGIVVRRTQTDPTSAPQVDDVDATVDNPDVIFVVLDTVRARSTSLCGHDRPTTPVLDGLGSDWIVSCSAITPGTWTIPSHASFFTGWPVPAFEGGQRTPEPSEILTGALAARGYQTVMVSANMVLKEPTWLPASFDRAEIARDFSALTGEALAEAVRREVSALDPDRPMFLFVNIIDAHAPYPAIPADLGWAPPQRAVQHRMWQPNPQTHFNRFVGGRMPAEEAARYSRRLENGYDYAISRADQTFGGLLDALGASGRLDGARVVVTSDHGEFVGEHQQIGHGDTLYEPGVRVPLVVRLAPGDPALTLPDPFPAAEVFHLLRDGVLPDSPRPTSVATFRDSQRTSYDGVALWGEDGEKFVWHTPPGTSVKDAPPGTGSYARYDLAADPQEDDPGAVDPGPLRDELETLIGAHRRAVEGTVAPTDDTIELLRAAGYVE